MSTRAVAMGRAKAVAVPYPWTQWLAQSIVVGIVLTLGMSLVVTADVVSPFVTGKALYARAMIDILAGLWGVLLAADRRYRPRRSWVLIAFGLYLTVALLSAVAGVNLSNSLWSDYHRMTGLWDVFHWLLFALVCASVLCTARMWAIVLNGNLAVSLLLSLLALARAYGLPGFVEGGRVYSTTGNPSYLAAILVVTSILAAGLLAQSFTGDAKEDWHARRRLWAMRGFWAGVALLGVWVIFLTGTRGALAALAAGGLVMTGVAMVRHRQLIKPVTIGAGGLLLAAGVLAAADLGGALRPGAQGQTTLSRLAHTTISETSVATRLELLGMAWRGFLAKPLLGWGHDNFGSVFDRYAQPSLYQYDEGDYAYPHNKLAEELATKGIVGLAAYLALWGVLLWAALRFRGDAGEQALTFGVAGALAAYFVQNLFLFDTAAALPQWALLLAWVASREMQQRKPVKVEDRVAGKKGVARKGSGGAAKSGAFGTAVATTAAVAVLAVGASLYFLAYRPFHSERLYYRAFESKGPLEERLALAQASFNEFPPMSGPQRRELLYRLNGQWREMSRREQESAFSFALDQWQNHLGNAPTDARFLSATLPMLQLAAPKEALAQLDPLVQRLQALAPNRAYTTWRAAEQELLRGDREKALALVEGFEARTPRGKELMAPLRTAMSS